MNIIFLLYIVLVSKLCFSKPYYSGPGYSNDRDSENLPVASHQKKRLLSDDSSQMQDASSLYDGPSRYRKYQPSADSPYMRRDSRLDHDQSDFEADGKERREYYDNNAAAAKDSSIEVILDPRAKKAVAVVENSPSGQAMYDLSGWKNDNQDNNGEQVVNLVYPAERSANEKIQRKYNSEGYETGKFADNYEGDNSDYAAPAASKAGMRDRLVDSSEQMIKKKRSAEISKSQKAADTAKVDNNPVKRSLGYEKRKVNIELSKTDEKQSECPPHNTPQSADNKNLLQEVKRASEHWSQEQITALHNSILKANKDNSEMTNLKAMLSEMGLVENKLKRDANEKEFQNDKEVEAKREAQISEFNDEEDLSQDEAILNRDDRALSDDEKWEMDVNSAPQEPVEKRDVNDKEDIDKKRSNDNTSNEDLDSSDLALDSSNTRKKRQNADKKEEENAKDVAKLGITAENSETLKDKKFSKREADEGTKKEKRKLSEDADYDKQMANQIQAKIDAIKEKVKRDILEDQKRKRAKRSNSNSENSEYDEKSSNYKANTRKKRANMIQEKQMVYRPFQADQDEETELDGDFEDNKLYLQKRQAADDDWQYFDSRGRELSYGQNYYPQSRSRRSFENDYMEDSVPFHDGGMVSNKESLKNREKFRDSFADQDASNTNANEMNDSEYFGSLPLSYNGELTRYKRVKRDNPYKS